MSYQADIDFDKQQAEFGHDKAMANLEGSIKQKLAEGDYENARIMQDKQIAASAIENDKQRVIQQAELALKAKGIDMASIQAAIDAGVADPNTLKTWLGNQGISVEAPDPLASQKAAKEKSQQMFNSWASTHPDKVVETSPGVYAMKDPKDTTYYDFVNDSLYNEKKGTAATTKLNELPPADLTAAAQPGSPNNALYQEALKGAQAPMWKSSSTGSEGFFKNENTSKFSTAPSVGQSYNVGGKLYIVQSGVQSASRDNGRGIGAKDRYDYVVVKDVSTGNDVRIESDRMPAGWGS
jgi:hypothetical protein